MKTESGPSEDRVRPQCGQSQGPVRTESGHSEDRVRPSEDMSQALVRTESDLVRT